MSVLQGLHSHLTFLFRPGFADPYNATPNGVQWVIVRDDLHGLSAPQSETSPQSETLRRAIGYQARKSFIVSSEVNDNTSASRLDDPL